MNTIFIKDTDEIKKLIAKKHPVLFVGSRTSTVIPYEKIEMILGDTNLADLSKLEKKMDLDENGNLRVSGAVTWADAMDFCKRNGRKVMTSPTEELALCLSGIATSATGERCFGYGTLRDQIVDLTFIDGLGNEQKFKASEPIDELSLFDDPDARVALSAYQFEYIPYSMFKNAPFPRFEKSIDLLIGTEGQLGVVTEATFKTVPWSEAMYLFIKLPKWEENYEPHLEVFEKVQGLRSLIYACELIDDNSSKYLPEDKKIASDCDLIFLEICQDRFEEVYDKFVGQLKLTSADNIFELSAKKCREFRMNIPRYIFEANQHMKVSKVGTDVQVKPGDFSKLMDIYRSWSKLELGYNLFGHFGDAHLHFNFMPSEAEYPYTQDLLEEFYKEVFAMKGSPFAEHGVGILKRRFIEQFYSDNQRQMFKLLKEHFDPENIFFPQGFFSF